MAAALALVLISRGGGSDDPGPVTLKGSTTRGEPVSLKVIDGRVESFTARIGVSCPFQRVWHGWDWAAHGPFGGEGKDFEYGDRNRFPEGGRFLSVIRGRLIGDGARARGTIETNGTWPVTGGTRSPCRSSLSFEASKPTASGAISSIAAFCNKSCNLQEFRLIERRASKRRVASIPGSGERGNRCGLLAAGANRPGRVPGGSA